MNRFMIEIQKTGSTPYIIVDEEKGYMKFEGECYHENVLGFFKEINIWLENFLHGSFDILTFDCELQYFNSSTAKLLLNMLFEMDDCAAEGKQIVINWITTANNEIIMECGEDFKEELDHLVFNMVIHPV